MKIRELGRHRRVRDPEVAATAVSSENASWVKVPLANGVPVEFA